MSEQNNPPTGDPAPPQGGVAPYERPVDNTVPPSEEPLEHKREDIRGKLANRLSWLFVGAVVALFGSAIYGGEQWTRVQEFSQIAFGVIAGVVGTIIGFYFGSQR